MHTPSFSAASSAATSKYFPSSSKSRGFVSDLNSPLCSGSTSTRTTCVCGSAAISSPCMSSRPPVSRCRYCARGKKCSHDCSILAYILQKQSNTHRPRRQSERSNQHEQKKTCRLKRTISCHGSCILPYPCQRDDQHVWKRSCQLENTLCGHCSSCLC